MIKILLTNNDNSDIEVDLIRYFKYKNDYFLIYTLGETDEKNYLKLYLVKIMEELGETISINIKDDNEWKSMQGLMKRVLKEIKSNKTKLLEDLPYEEIVGIKVVNPRFFKLDHELANTLSSNYLENNQSTLEIIPLEIGSDIGGLEMEEQEIKTISPIVEEIDYKTLYFAIKEEKEATDKLLDDLLDKLTEYKLKYGDLQEE